MVGKGCVEVTRDDLDKFLETTGDDDVTAKDVSEKKKKWDGVGDSEKKNPFDLATCTRSIIYTFVQ